MTRIGLISDTHHFLDPGIAEYFKDCDEIWHAGDFGTIAIAEELMQLVSQKNPLGNTNSLIIDNKRNNQLPVPVHPVFRGVYGNIDGKDIRSVYPEQLHFFCEQVKVFMKHIGGYPNRYARGVKQEIIDNKSGLFISGHSHILKVMYDKQLKCLHMNPGAAGKQGWHKIRTIIRFSIDGHDITNCEVIEL